MNLKPLSHAMREASWSVRSSDEAGARSLRQLTADANYLYPDGR
jgi:hypothetical protein